MRRDRPPEARLSPLLQALSDARKAAEPKRSKISAGIKRKLWRDYCGACAYCGRMLYQFDAWLYRPHRRGHQQIEPLLPVIDHKQPLAHGGTNDIDNLCLACWHCNSAKGGKTEQEFMEAIA